MHDAVAEIRTGLESLADPLDAEPMATYMKNRFAFLGVKTPTRRTVSKEMIASSKQWDIDDVIRAAVDLRSLPEREFHYVASDLLRRNAARLRADDLTTMRELIVTDAWWDTVDALASPTVGQMVLNHPAVSDAMDVWVDDDDLWIARTAIIHQLRFGDRTDTERLFDYSLRRADHTDLFIRKAIGWALRQFAKTEPGAVRAFLDAHGDRFAPLTVREAAKHL